MGDGEAGGQTNSSHEVDYVLVYKVSDANKGRQLQRNAFEAAMVNEGLVIQREVIGNRCFLSVFAPFERLCKEAERCGHSVPLIGCEVQPSRSTYCPSISKYFVTEDTVDHINAPFQLKLAHLYLNYNKPEEFFRPAQRSLLVHQILIEIDISESLREGSASSEEGELSRKGLLYLRMKGAYQDAFILHDPSQDEPYYKNLKRSNFLEYCKFVSELKRDSRRELSAQWKPFYKFQPLNKIRDYFGEKIAFYFAWEGTFISCLWPAAILGVFCFAYGIASSALEDEINFNECVSSDEPTEPPKPCDFSQKMSELAQLLTNAFDNRLNPLFAIFISIWGSVFYQIWSRNRSVLAYLWDVEQYTHSELDRPEFFGTRKETDPITGLEEWFYPQTRRILKCTLSFAVVILWMCIAIGSVLAVILLKLFLKSDLECAVSAEFDLVCTVTTSLLPSVLNTLSTMFLGTIYGVVADRLTYWENHRTMSEHNNALVVKLFAFQFVNNYSSLFYLAFIRPEIYGLQRHGLFGLGEKFKDTCTLETCSSQLALQVLSHMLIKPIPKFCKDILLAYFLRMVRYFRFRQRIAATPNSARSETEVEESNRLQREWIKPNAGDFTLGEFTEKIIQFGSVMMFASQFPLAPLLALLIGLADIRIDARRLLWFNRRPIVEVASDIGIWREIIKFIEYAAVLTNTLIVAFTSDFCRRNIFQSGPGDCSTEARLIIAIVFQNTVFASKFLISNLIPEVPSGIRVAQRRKRFIVGKVIENGFLPQFHRKRNRAEWKARKKFRKWWRITRSNNEESEPRE